jgi:hypothetical protein
MKEKIQISLNKKFDTKKTWGWFESVYSRKPDDGSGFNRTGSINNSIGSDSGRQDKQVGLSKANYGYKPTNYDFVIKIPYQALYNEQD